MYVYIRLHPSLIYVLFHTAQLRTCYTVHTYTSLLLLNPYFHVTYTSLYSSMVVATVANMVGLCVCGYFTHTHVFTIFATVAASTCVRVISTCLIKYTSRMPWSCDELCSSNGCRLWCSSVMCVYLCVGSSVMCVCTMCWCCVCSNVYSNETLCV